MRKFSVFIFLIFYSFVLSAQTTPVSAPPPVSNIHPNTVESASLTIANPNKAGTVHLGSKGNMAVTNTIADNIAKAENCKKFYILVQAAGLTETFKSAGPITLFIPDDDAFGKISRGRMDTLLRKDHLPELVALITYHAVPGKMSAGYIMRQIRKQKNAAVFTTLSGGRITAKTDGTNIILIDEMGKQSTLNQSNMEQSNGMIFMISDVLIPKKQADINRLKYDKLRYYKLRN